MNYPTYLWLTPANELLITDTMNFRIQRFDAEFGLLGVFGEAGDSTGSLARPKGVAMDRHGHIYVVDGGHHALQIFDREGQLLLAVGEQGQDSGEFWLPTGVFATAEDLIFVADAFNQRVQVFRYEEEGS
jgi:sugar lactone lactonase YvrE